MRTICKNYRAFRFSIAMTFFLFTLTSMIFIHKSASAACVVSPSGDYVCGQAGSPDLFDNLDDDEGYDPQIDNDDVYIAPEDLDIPEFDPTYGTGGEDIEDLINKKLDAENHMEEILAALETFEDPYEKEQALTIFTDWVKDKEEVDDFVYEGGKDKILEERDGKIYFLGKEVLPAPPDNRISGLMPCFQVVNKYSCTDNEDASGEFKPDDTQVKDGSEQVYRFKMKVSDEFDPSTKKELFSFDEDKAEDGSERNRKPTASFSVDNEKCYITITSARKFIDYENTEGEILEDEGMSYESNGKSYGYGANGMITETKEINCAGKFEPESEVNIEVYTKWAPDLTGFSEYYLNGELAFTYTGMTSFYDKDESGPRMNLKKIDGVIFEEASRNDVIKTADGGQDYASCCSGGGASPSGGGTQQCGGNFPITDQPPVGDADWACGEGTNVHCGSDTSKPGRVASFPFQYPPATGKKIYVSSSGCSGSGGSSEGSPLCASAVPDLNLNPGDQVLFKAGESYNIPKTIIPKNSGAANNYIKYGSFGNGNKPILNFSGAAFNINDKSHIQIDGLHIKTPSAGITIKGNSNKNIISRNRVEGTNDNTATGIRWSNTTGGSNFSEVGESYVISNEVHNFKTGIGGRGGSTKASLIANNFVHSTTVKDGKSYYADGEDAIEMARGDYRGSVMRNNEITGWRDDAVDLFGARNAIVENNYIHDLATVVNGSGIAIKLGGTNDWDRDGHVDVSGDNIARGNVIHGLNPLYSEKNCMDKLGMSKDNMDESRCTNHSEYRALSNGIATNGSSNSKAYDNFIFDIDGQAITSWAGKNNDLYNNKYADIARQPIYVGGGGSDNIYDNEEVAAPSSFDIVEYGASNGQDYGTNDNTGGSCDSGGSTPAPGTGTATNLLDEYTNKAANLACVGYGGGGSGSSGECSPDFTAASISPILNADQLEEVKITDSSIDDAASNQLTVTFDKPINASNADGFRLTGGPAQIKGIKSVNGNQVTFELSDHVLPDDNYNLEYWYETGDMGVDGGKKAATITPTAIKNNATQYNGNGEIHYVSNGGQSFEQAQAKAKPGDYILFKRGENYQGPLTATKSGTKDAYITYGAYGSGAKPKITYNSNAKRRKNGQAYFDSAVHIHGQSYIQVDGLEINLQGSGVYPKTTGIHIADGAKDIIISNNDIPNESGECYFGINYMGDNTSNEAGLTKLGWKPIERPQILNNKITGCIKGIGTSSWPATDLNNTIGGALIENNIIYGYNKTASRDIEAIHINRGKMSGTIVRKNKITNYVDNAIEVFGASDVIIEYNEISNNVSDGGSGGGTAIKMGGFNNNSGGLDEGRSVARNNIARYNYIHDLSGPADCSCIGIKSAAGLSGQIYGNVIQDVQGSGIKVENFVSKEAPWIIKDNTILNAGKTGIDGYITSYRGETHNALDNLIIENNVVDGSKYDISITDTTNGGKKAVGKNNTLINNKVNNKTYSGTGDTTGNLTDGGTAVDTPNGKKPIYAASAAPENAYGCSGG